MKITTNNNVMNNYADLRIHTKDNSTPSAVSNDGHNFDAVIIKSDPRQIEERTFAKDVSRRLSSEMKDTASADKLHNLQEQITAKTYHVDAHAIAARMLLL
ncbi:MAG: flagellar biosynthesis anti-sigma factor FlgM [Dorea sp.]|nr:flagellar biosynthesis anti-sigma factor FlgM [Dorea sp.]